MLKDYEYAQLTDDEILEEEAKKRRAAANEAEDRRIRTRRQTNFRFTGGMV